MNWLERKIFLYNVTIGLYMLDWWERYLIRYTTYSVNLVFNQIGGALYSKHTSTDCISTLQEFVWFCRLLVMLTLNGLNY